MTRKGLTLIEVMIASVTIGLLAAILFPTFAAARQRRNASTCADNLRRIYRALQLYQADWDGQLPPHNPIDPVNSVIREPGSFRSALPGPIVEWSQYGMTWESFRCPAMQHDEWLHLGYEFRLAVDLEFDDRWNNGRRLQVLHQHPTWMLSNASEFNRETPDMLQRTVVPEPGSVLVVCDAHVRRGNTWPPETVTGFYQVLRADGRVERVPAAAAKYRGYKNGQWYSAGSRMPEATELILTFPGEPWPPRFRP